ncbi:MAG: hypothetical protein K8U03_21415 [Planctomycetia bacterium]|nr:hypothetical protein [Planctomycetia bacterium]
MNSNMQDLGAKTIKSLAWRLTLPIMFVGLLMTVFGISAAVYVHWEYRSRSDYVARQVAGLNTLQNLLIAERDLRYTLREFLLKGDVSEIDAATRLQESIVRLTDESETLVGSERGMQLVARIREGEKLVYVELKKIRGLPLPAMRQEVLSLLNDILEPKLIVPTKEYSDMKQQSVQLGLERTEQFAQMLVITMTSLGLCGVTAGVLWGLAAARGIGRSLVELTVPIKNAAGQLNEAVGPLTVHSHWNFNELPIVVDQIAEQVGEVIEQMRASERRAVRSEQLAAVGQLSAGMAHELRNPLTSMKLIVQKARKKPGSGDEMSGRDLEILEEEIERLERVVGGILDYARPPQAQFDRIDLVEVVRRSAELISDRFRRRGMQLVVDLPASPCFVSGDPAQLRQVLLNLLLNAMDAGEKGQTVRLRYRTKSAKSHDSDSGSKTNAAHVVEVADQGTGLPKDPTKDIFEPFVSTKETGLGLGLSISRQIVEAHHGCLLAADDPHGGAVFSVELPVFGSVAVDCPPTTKSVAAAGVLARS